MRKQSKKSLIDKTNKLWEWSKPDKQFKAWYKKEYGIEAQELGMMTDKAYKLYEKLIFKNE